MSVTHTTRPTSIDEIAAEMDRRGAVIERLEARLAHIDGIYKGAIDNLNHHQTQLDMDGVMVGVSRQALCEVLAGVEAALAAQPAAKADERVVALLDERQKRAEQVHDRILAARDGIRVNLSPDSPEWLRDAFNKLHEAHHIMGGDPFDMHMRAALAAKDGRHG